MENLKTDTAEQPTEDEIREACRRLTELQVELGGRKESEVKLEKKLAKAERKNNPRYLSNVVRGIVENRLNTKNLNLSIEKILDDMNVEG